MSTTYTLFHTILILVKPLKDIYLFLINRTHKYCSYVRKCVDCKLVKEVFLHCSPQKCSNSRHMLSLNLGPIVEESIYAPSQETARDTHPPSMYESQLQIFVDMKEEMAEQQAFRSRAGASGTWSRKHNPWTRRIEPSKLSTPYPDYNSIKQPRAAPIARKAHCYGGPRRRTLSKPEAT